MVPPIAKKNNITFDLLQQLSILDALARILFVFFEFAGLQIDYYFVHFGEESKTNLLNSSRTALAILSSVDSDTVN